MTIHLKIADALRRLSGGRLGATPDADGVGGTESTQRRDGTRRQGEERRATSRARPDRRNSDRDRRSE
jgi:hypothetical protein